MTIAVLLGAFGPTEIMLVVGAMLLLFGGKKLPGLFKGFGTGLREFKEAREGKISEEIVPEVNAVEKK